MVDRFRRRSSVLGQAVPVLLVWAKCGIHDGNCDAGQGSGVIGRTDGLERLGIL